MIPASAPFAPALSMAIAGIIVIKIPANNLATSTIGNQVYSFACRIFCGVTFQLTNVKRSNRISLVKFCSSNGT